MGINLSISIFDYCYTLAKKQESKWRKKLGSKYGNTVFSNNYQFIGHLGEIIYGLHSGEMFDSRQYIEGDDGTDFSKGVQVKTSEIQKAKYLIEYTTKDFSKFKYFVLVLVDLEAKTGYVHGWISVKEFLSIKEIKNFGYGDRYAVHIDKLNKIERELDMTPAP